MPSPPQLQAQAPTQFVINAAAGRSDAQAKRDVIAAALERAGRTGELLLTQPADLPRVAQEAAQKAKATQAALVAVGGDGTIHTVAQAAHAQGCVMGVIAQGTFNYFARTHGIPTEPAQAAQLLFDASAQPVQVGSINGQVFLVNASLGLYPQLLEDREAYKARFGRSRFVALGAACVTLLRAHRLLRLHIDLGSSARDVRTTTLFVGNNRLQLAQVGLPMDLCPVRGFDNGRIYAVMLRPMGTLAMMRLMLRGAMGTLGEAEGVESFEFDHLLIKPRIPYGAGKVKVAMDGEVKWMRWPIEFAVPATPLYLIKPSAPLGQTTLAQGGA
jgi:diacylglycerol kinase family enzyme